MFNANNIILYAYDKMRTTRFRKRNHVPELKST